MSNSTFPGGYLLPFPFSQSPFTIPSGSRSFLPSVPVSACSPFVPILMSDSLPLQGNVCNLFLDSIPLQGSPSLRLKCTSLRFFLASRVLNTRSFCFSGFLGWYLPPPPHRFPKTFFTFRPPGSFRVLMLFQRIGYSMPSVYCNMSFRPIFLFSQLFF